MSRLVARLILAMLLLPVTGSVIVLYFAIVLVPGPAPPSVSTLLFMWILVYAVIALYWGMLWRGDVRWTPQRKLRTVLIVPGAIAVGVAVGVTINATTRAFVPASMLVGGGVVPVVGVLASVLVWRETPRERLERLAAAGYETVACPLCGYNLTGLHEARCPECGGRFTLEQLLSAQLRARPERTLNEDRAKPTAGMRP